MSALPDWLVGKPMDPTAISAERLPPLAGFPFMHLGASAVIVGPTGGGRSSLIEACLYDAAMAGLRCAYLGHEVTEDEFNARAAVLAERRGDKLAVVKARLAAVRYLDLMSTIVAAWANREAWIDGVSAHYDVLAIDPLSAVDSALDLDFDKSNREFVTFYDGLILPLTARGVAVPMVDNIGHAEEAKRRAKGVSAKWDKSDLTFTCTARATPSSALAIKADKVRSVRAPHRRGEEWLFDEATQRVERAERASEDVVTGFRPTNIMEKVSREVETHDGLSKRAIRVAIGGNASNVDLAVDLLIAEGHIERRKEGQAYRHHLVEPYRQAADQALDRPTESTESEPCPTPCPDTDPATVSDRVRPPLGGGPDRDSVSGEAENGQPSPSAYDPHGAWA